MIDRAHDLPITKQAKALNISRGSVHYVSTIVASSIQGTGAQKWRSTRVRG